jgi:hypothetical protein
MTMFGNYKLKNGSHKIEVLSIEGDYVYYREVPNGEVILMNTMYLINNYIRL